MDVTLVPTEKVVLFVLDKHDFLSRDFLKNLSVLDFDQPNVCNQYTRLRFIPSKLIGVVAVEQ